MKKYSGKYPVKLGKELGNVKIEKDEIGMCHFLGKKFYQIGDNFRIKGIPMKTITEDGSFIKIKNLQLGYNFSSSTLTRAGISKLRVYAQVKNAFTFTKYSGFDPEISGGIFETGIDRGAYPQARSFSLGLDLKF